MKLFRATRILNADLINKKNTSASSLKEDKLNSI